MVGGEREGGSLRVSKVDAAFSQFDTALRLWFGEGDPVSVHTLASAAEGILRDLPCEAGPPHPVESDVIRDEYRAEWNRMLKRPANFFKHANHDRDGVIDFDPEQTVFVLLWIYLRLKALGRSAPVTAEAFGLWILAHRTNLVKAEARAQLEAAGLGPGLLAELRGGSRAQLLRGVERAVRLRGVSK